MACKSLRDIKPDEKPMPIEVRVLKKWFPVIKKNDVIIPMNELCYQFVDIHGDAIEASADANKVEYFDSKMQLFSCYRITEYVCTNRRLYMSTVKHAASIVLGDKAQFTPLPHANIPHAYFDFADYASLKPRWKDNRILTDYIGRVKSNFLRPTTKNKLLRKTLIQDEWQKEVEITIWPEMQYLYGDEVKEGDIIAITAATVTYYDRKDMIQLESNNCTTVYINPSFPETAPHMERLKNLPDIPKTTNDRRLMVFDLKPENLSNIQEPFQCKCQASVTKMFEQRGWFYGQCSKCNSKLFQQHDEGRVTFVCKNHDDFEPRLMYCVNVLIDDNTGPAEAVLFNEAMTALLKIPCQELVLGNKYFNPKKLPPQMTSAMNIPKMLHITVNKNKHLIVNNVTDAEETTNEAAEHSHTNASTLLPPTPNPKMQAGKRPQTDSPDLVHKAKTPKE